MKAKIFMFGILIALIMVFVSGQTENNDINNETDDIQDHPEVTGNYVSVFDEGNSLYWLIALGIIILVTGGILYTQERK